MQNPDAKILAVKAAQKFFSEDKDRSFEAKVSRWNLGGLGRLSFFFLFPSATQMMDESSRLLTLQEQLEKEADGKVTFLGLSVNETMRACLLNGMAKRADKVKADFKVPDKRFVVLPNLRL